jgi:hypothetical protein
MANLNLFISDRETVDKVSNKLWLGTTGETTKTTIRLKNKIPEIHSTEKSLVTAYHNKFLDCKHKFITFSFFV